jgi:tRNA-Thr(GGU) m(6)t(6)A37 methyltransferase TsaA
VDQKKEKCKIQLKPIGKVVSNESEGLFHLEIETAYRAGLKGLDQFSHVLVFWWADKIDREESRSIVTAELPYAPGVEVGVFACRSEYRPNPVAVTIVPILSINEQEGIVVFPWIDAFDGSPVIDLKPYIPICDRIRNIKVPDWIADWPMWMEDAGAYFAEHETDFGE